MVRLPTLGTLPVYGAAQPKWLAPAIRSYSQSMARSPRMVQLIQLGALIGHGTTLSLWRAPIRWCYSRNMARSDHMVLLQIAGALSFNGPTHPVLARTAQTVQLIPHGSLSDHGSTLSLRLAPVRWSNSLYVARSWNMV